MAPPAAHTVEQARVGIADVAAECGVSITTVSRALNESAHSARIPETTRRQIRQIAQRLGYRANWAAKSLAKKRTHTIGILYYKLPIVLGGIYRPILEAISSSLGQAGYQMLLSPLREDDPAAWNEVINEQRWDGCLIVSTSPPGLTDLLVKAGTPFVMVNTGSEAEAACVEFDDYGAALLLTRHYLQLGHRRIAFAYQEHDAYHASMAKRLAGYEAAMHEANLPPQKIVATPRELPARLSAGTSSLPTALICYSDTMAFLTIGEFWCAKLKLPEDFTVGAFGDQKLDSQLPITLAALPAAEMGRRSVEMLLQRLKGGPLTEPAKRVVLPASLVVHEPNHSAISSMQVNSRPREAGSTNEAQF